MIQLTKVNTSDKEHGMILFELLKKRKYFISHKKTPSLKEHLHFFENNPYRIWYILYLENDLVGAAYCTYQNLIGINLIKDKSEIYKNSLIKIISDVSPLPPKPSVRSGNFCINVSPQNKKLQMALKELNAIEIQKTYFIN